MGTVAPINVLEIGVLFFGGALLRFAYAKSWARNTPATKEDMEAIRAALASEGGQVIRANRDRSAQPFARDEYFDERGGRLYHVTLQIGSVRIRRRIAVRDGAPAILLP